MGVTVCMKAPAHKPLCYRVGFRAENRSKNEKNKRKNFLLLALAPRERLQTFGLSETPDEPQHVYCEPRRSNRGQVKCWCTVLLVMWSCTNMLLPHKHYWKADPSTQPSWQWGLPTASSLPHSAGQCATHTHNKNCLGVVYRTERKAVTLSLNSQDPSLIVNMHLNKPYPGPHAPHRTQMICCQFPGGTGTAGQLQRVPMRRWLNEWRQVEYLLYIWQEEHWFLNN